jgi:hypothetical protein
MFDSAVLDVAIGLVFIYFFLSLLCSVIIEGVTALIKKRPRMLRDAISSLLDDPKALEKIYDQPLFMGTTPKSLLRSLGQALLPFRKKRSPSYISSRSFVLSLLESLKQHPDVVKKICFPEGVDKIQGFKDKLNLLPDDNNIKKALVPLTSGNDAEALTNIHDWFDKAKDKPDVFKEILKNFKDQIPSLDNLPNISKLVEALPDDNAIKRALTPLIESAGKGSDALEKALASMEKWYDEAMERVTGWYKRYSQTFALILAFLVALGLNADTFAIGKAIYRDQALRASLVTMAEDVAKTPPPLTTSTDSNQRTEGGQSSSGQKKPKEGKQKTGKSSPPADPKKQKEGKASSPTDSEKKIQAVKKYYKEISKLNLPLGWDKWLDKWKDELKKQNLYDPDKGILDYPKFLGFWFPKSLPSFPGILFTAFLVSLGSNFWFELLNKLINLRNAGKKPLTREEEEARRK